MKLILYIINHIRVTCKSTQKATHHAFLKAPAVTEVDKAVLAYLEAFFASDRSSSEILKLSNRLFNLGQAYNKTAK
ncbi:hypothetical protein MZA99_01075 [Haemophilus influenzae]